ncbi:hypothetical protein AL035_17840 [Salipiger aestuarii]|uniref:Uncharacterized protein n=1 Tax=Salipiger aestuarii TaxID=568098 RepID=A0A327YSF0_9RHOB|nr:hypothetical protein [Salipiger aestuarii]KAB2539669.1 hypothetical protein AL035_17840 [Salipiger aestuarii]RAK24094.1 hypothetical protein ATI53_1001201 [Salipiger aestuarii]
MSDPPEMLAFIAAATALSLRRGGMRVCGDHIAALGHAMPLCPTDGPLRDALSAGQAVVSARAAADEFAFDQARTALSVALAAYWGGRALGLHSAVVRG